jgi:hypothetical protein
MTQREHILFIDANQYLDLFRVAPGWRLLSPLRQLQDHIFITDQVAAEVSRNKLEVAGEFLVKQFNKLPEVTKFGLPDHLFGETDDRVRQLDNELKETVKRTKELNSELTKLSQDILRRVSRSEDEVSKTLDSIFASVSLQVTLRKNDGRFGGA